jgi:hypothetical protein
MVWQTATHDYWQCLVGGHCFYPLAGRSWEGIHYVCQTVSEGQNTYSDSRCMDRWMDGWMDGWKTSMFVDTADSPKRDILILLFRISSKSVGSLKPGIAKGAQRKVSVNNARR